MRMQDLRDRLRNLEIALIQALPTRHVTRSFKNLDGWSNDQLTSGVWQIVSDNGSELNGELDLAGGTHNVMLVAYVRVADNEQQYKVEDAELAMLKELADFLDDERNCGLDMVSWQQSKQLEHPYGWLVVSLAWSDL